MGLGPNQSSLLERVAGWSQPWRDPFAMQLEQQDRREARQEKARWHAAHRAAPRKPEAPVEPMPKQKGKPREWRWIGQLMAMKGFEPAGVYSTETLRKAGFKLPVLKKGKK